MDRPVFDQTGLEGEYLIPVEPIVREEMLALKARAPATPGAVQNPSPEAAGSGIFGVMQSLGLKLEPQRVALPLLVVDRAEKRPTEN